MKKILLGVLLIVLTATAAWSQTRTGRDPFGSEGTVIAVRIDGLQCTSSPSSDFVAHSWSWGAVNNFNFKTGSKTSVAQVTLTRYFDECSPALFQYSLMSKPFDMVLEHKKDGVVLTRLSLKGAYVQSYELDGSSSSSAPESVTFSFAKITVDNDKGQSTCFDLLLNAPCQ